MTAINKRIRSLVFVVLIVMLAFSMMVSASARAYIGTVRNGYDVEHSGKTLATINTTAVLNAHLYFGAGYDEAQFAFPRPVTLSAEQIYHYDVLVGLSPSSATAELYVS